MTMKSITLSVGAAILLTVLGGQPAQTARNQEEVLYLCSALVRANAGQRIPVRLSGVILSGMEQQVFFDPDYPLCPWDVQPSTWVEVSSQAPGRNVLDRILEASHSASVTIRGELYGPKPLGPEDLSVNPIVAYANRVSGRRYGHLDGFRTKLVVNEVLEAHPAPREIAARVIRFRTEEKPPLVVAAEVPKYPEMARRAGISGEVVLKVVVQAGKVISTKLLSGERLLGAEAAANIETWQFRPETSKTLTTTFVYHLEQRPTGSSANARIELQLPLLIRVTAAKEGW